MTTTDSQTTSSEISNWQNSLREQGANVADGYVVDFGNAKDELKYSAKDNTLCDLSHLALLEIDGEDAVTFLQGQVTNDVNLLNGSNAHLTGHCNPKGRMLALFLAFGHNDNDHIHLQFNRNLLEPMLKRLKMYVLRAKVNINDASDRTVKFGVNGPNTEEILSPLFDNLPKENYALVTLDNAAIIKLPSVEGHTRYEIFTNPEHAPILWNTIKEQCKPVGKPCWDWLDIQSGIPDITTSTQEQFVPQMLNLDILNGINFKKGCYTGQEIVARTHYLGSVKRRTFLASISASEMPQPGDKLMDNTQNEAGQIVSVAPNTDNGFDVLAEMRIEAKNAGEITWQNIPLQMHDLPYSLESEK